jgi:hypothetical protein
MGEMFHMPERNSMNVPLRMARYRGKGTSTTHTHHIGRRTGASREREVYLMTGMSSDAMSVSTYLVNSLIFSSPNLVLMLCTSRRVR